MGSPTLGFYTVVNFSWMWTLLSSLSFSSCIRLLLARRFVHSFTILIRPLYAPSFLTFNTRKNLKKLVHLPISFRIKP